MKSIKMLAVAAVAAVFGVTSAYAGAIVSGGNVMLGVKDTGALNFGTGPASPVTGTTLVGLRYIPTGNEATSHGCVCEGWGVGIGETGVSGYDGTDNGFANLTVVSFVDDGTTATSVTELTSGELRITHVFAPAPETPDLYRVTVTIENISGTDITDLRYTRAMDWDIEPTTFSEYSTIQGTAAATAVIYADDNGFASTDPFGFRSALVDSGDFVDSGPADHGALFDFAFGALADGESFTFEIFYGAADTELAALTALSAVGAEVYSFGQCSSDPMGLGGDDPSTGAPCNTFIFGFAGVGGVVVPPPSDIPAPAALPLLLSGLAGLGFAARRRKQTA